jgi:putative ABC transport system permease protein
VPFWVNFDIDARVLVFVGLVTLVTSVVTGIIPALKASKLDLNSAIKDGGSGGNLRLSRMTRLLVNIQMALSVSLVVAAGLFLTLLLGFNQKRLSYDPRSVLSARVALNEKDFAELTQSAAVFESFENRLSSMPGVVGVTTVASESLRSIPQQIQFEGIAYAKRSDSPTVLADTVTPNFFNALQIPLRDGRLFTSADIATTPDVAVVNASFAQRFGGENGVIGRRFKVASADGSASWITIVGVVADAGSLKAGRDTDGATFYRPMSQEPFRVGTILLRVNGAATSYADMLRQVIAERDRNIAVNKVHTLQHIVEMERIGINLPGALLIICGVGALALATVGVYGVLSFSVKTRTRELGVRLALGASRRDILRLIMGEGLKQISIGLGAGVLLALGVSAVLASMFTGFGRTSYDLPIYAAVLALLTLIGSGALFIPARRATKVDPMIALRAE